MNTTGYHFDFIGVEDKVVMEDAHHWQRSRGSCEAQQIRMEQDVVLYNFPLLPALPPSLPPYLLPHSTLTQYTY